MHEIDIYATWMIIVFCLGYILITIEHITAINKATIALMMAIICWVLQFARPHWKGEENIAFLGEHLADISQVVFFLLGALAIVELINLHKGFKIISENIAIRSKRKLLWVIGFITFFLSAILDNLTTTIVMVSLLSKLVDKSNDRLLIGGGIVIAANAGGAWTPIGDVTTTMLWIGGEISTLYVLKDLFLPSIVCLIGSFVILTFMLEGDFDVKVLDEKDKHMEPMGTFIFFLGVGCLVFVPIFKLLTGMPPFMGILFGLSVMWLATDIIHRSESRAHLTMPNVLSKIDLASVLFFLGILLAIDALETGQMLKMLANWFSQNIASTAVIATLIGLASAVVDNVPLVAATMGMYDLATYPQDHPFWELIAYCAGTGGSILIIGSAAGVVFMGLEKADFFWYLKRISIPAAVGYFAGIGVYLLLQ